MLRTTTRAWKPRRYCPTDAALEVRLPVSSLVLLPDLIPLATAVAVDGLSPAQPDRDAGQRGGHAEEFIGGLTGARTEVGEEAATPTRRRWVTTPMAADDVGIVIGWGRSGAITTPDVIGTIVPTNLASSTSVTPVPEGIPPRLASGDPTEPSIAAVAPAAAVAADAVGSDVTSRSGTERAAEIGIRPMSLPPHAGPMGADETTVISTAFSGGSGGGSGGSGGSGGGAGLSISFTGGGAPVQVDGQYYDAIGNQVTVRVQSHNDTMTSVKWIVSGGIKDYTFTVDKAEVVPFGQVNDNGQMVTGEERSFNPAATSDTLSLIWDEAGTFTVTAKATFSNNPSQSESVTVIVQEPNVDQFKNEQKPFIFNIWGVPDQQGQLDYIAYGLIHQAFNPSQPGNKFTAQVDTVPKPENKGGQFAFLQTVDDWQQVIEFENGQKPIDINVTEAILDDFTGVGGSALFMKGYTSQIYAADTDNIQLPDGTFPITDSPTNLSRWVDQYPDIDGDYEVKFVLKAKFTTYLMFRPYSSSGRWIAIANLPWELDGTAEYNGPENGTPADYLNKNNWGVTIVKPTGSSTLNGTPGVEFVEWDGKVSDHL
jgi:hypothetical protein